ncbi:GPW/gp25 family protein [Sphingomonas sp. QA11]|uniref:GPW/gp25 family protein n=1 Tax=Sphingomonas sp. QA11 TaxID=2950605 RepID=UPI00234909DD|nr:GPW/gp25 family protein [Sphingomonas sp. QA11]WCM29201.1 GPW/gp25 family protein [Sphingomonas sp. QA11]
MNGMDASTGKLIGGEDHLRQSVADILGTPLGTRIGRRDYGSLLPELLDQPDNALTRLRIFAASALALQRQEPRLKSSRFSLRRGAQPGAAALTIAGTRTDAPRPNAGVTLTVPVRSLSALTA